MNGFEWPSWIGSPSQFGLLMLAIVSMVVAYIKIWPKIKELNINKQIQERAELYQRITELKAEVKECQDNCDAQTGKLQSQIDKLKDQVNNEALQRVQSEISLINILIDTVEPAQLKEILAALEKKQVRLRVERVELLTGAGDK